MQDGSNEEEEKHEIGGSHTPMDDELEEEEQDMVQTEEEAKFNLIDGVICGDLFERLAAF